MMTILRPIMRAHGQAVVMLDDSGRTPTQYGSLTAIVMIAALLASVFASLAPTSSAAQSNGHCPAMSLTVDTPDASYEVDCQLLETLPVETIVTDTPWTDGPSEFTGYSLYEIWQVLGLPGRSVRAQALDDYSATLCWSTIQMYRPILATTQDGLPLSVRTRGPYWLLLPFNDHPEIQSDEYFFKAVWQLSTLIDTGDPC